MFDKGSGVTETMEMVTAMVAEEPKAMAVLMDMVMAML